MSGLVLLFLFSHVHSSSLAQGTFLCLLFPDLSKVSLDSDPSASAAVFAFVNLNMLLGRPSAHISSIVIITGE